MRRVAEEIGSAICIDVSPWGRITGAGQICGFAGTPR